MKKTKIKELIKKLEDDLNYAIVSNTYYYDYCFEENIGNLSEQSRAILIDMLKVAQKIKGEIE